MDGDTAWGDLLTSYDGNAISYDAMGNPLSNGEWTYTWKHGRQLQSMSKGNTTWTYTYGVGGLRTKRTNGTNTYNYIYSGSKLAMMTVGENTLYFTYDATGTPLAVKYNGTTYYYKTNLQGDVIGIADSSGTEVVTYAYDAWGLLLNTSGTMKDTLGTINPLTYRSYVYDHDTGLYYLQSRYYDPEMGRFLNADILASTGQGFTGNNMYGYCLNCPSNMADYYGNDAVYVTNYDPENGGLWVVGHSQLYVQDEYGNWFVVEFTGPMSDPSAAKVYVYPAEEEIVNKMKEGEKITHIDYAYICGDFTDSLEAAQLLENTNYGGYNLFTNNCLHFVREMLKKGKYESKAVEKKINNSKTIVPSYFSGQIGMICALARATGAIRGVKGIEEG